MRGICEGNVMSAAASFTPGPWEMVKSLPNQGYTEIKQVRPKDIYVSDIATVYCCSLEPQQRANARLIAAAPELVAALQEALEFIDNQADGVDGGYGIPKPNRAMQVAREIREALAKAGVQ